nr:hypothetical protein [Tanacetum cinerariifolium]
MNVVLFNYMYAVVPCTSGRNLYCVQGTTNDNNNMIKGSLDSTGARSSLYFYAATGALVTDKIKKDKIQAKPNKTEHKTESCIQTRSSSRLVSNPSSNPTPSTNPNSKSRNRRRSKQRIEEFNLEELSPPIVMMADQLTMAQLLQAPTEGYEDAIVVSAITADNFELKHGLVTLVQNKQFFGHDKEDPYAHIRYFNKITSTLKFSNVLNTSIKLMLFPFSLEAATRIWLEKEPPRLIFRMILFRNSSTNSFLLPKQQISVMKSPIFNNVLMNLLVKHGTDSKIFLKLVLIMCLAIIESKSKVRYSRNKPVVAKVSMNTSTSGISPDVAELKDMVKALLLDKKNQNQAPATVKEVEKSCVTSGGAHSYRSCPATDGN